MKKKQTKKKISNRKKKNLTEKAVFANLEKKTSTETIQKKTSTGTFNGGVFEISWRKKMVN